jgi:nucleoside-diphosphate-sugar epimerase
MKKVLVTGGRGFIGSHLVRELQRRGYDVWVCDLMRSEKENYIRCDVSKYRQVEKIFEEHDFDYVYHAATEYGRWNGEDFVSLHLDTPYQINKLVGELYCNYFHYYYKLPVAIARYFNVYGPGEVPGRYRNVIPNFFWWAMHGQPLPITGTGEETRDFTYVGDIIDGTLRMGVIEEAVREAINLASGTETRIIDLANWINEITGNRAGVVFKSRRDWDKAIRRRASIEKAKKILGYEPKINMKTGLRRVYEWIMKNRDKIEVCVKF